MSDENVVLTLAGAVIAILTGLYLSALIWGIRAYARGLRGRLKVICEAVHRPSERRAVKVVDACIAILIRLTVGASALPIVLFVIPVALAIAGLDVTASVVRFGGAAP